MTPLLVALIAAMTFGIAFWLISMSLSARLTQTRAYAAELEQAIAAMRRTEAALRQDIRNSAARELFEDVPQPMVRVIAGGCEYVVRLADLPCSERVM